MASKHALCRLTLRCRPIVPAWLAGWLAGCQISSPTVCTAAYPAGWLTAQLRVSCRV